jgi:hypothetical protein
MALAAKPFYAASYEQHMTHPKCLTELANGSSLPPKCKRYRARRNATESSR